ncbi:MAG: segregation/condensation protein A [Rhodospirillales bacterium]|jgi:segregation and condensation protein A|nr:segregation/condensation protein A [Rhodospirillales bacterium]
MTAWAERESPFDAEVRSDGNEAFVVDLDGFAGPIDVLLSLARSQKVDLSRISIVRLADQYLDFVAAARRRSLQVAAEYLVTAAWLAYLKSRLLLPRPVLEDDEPEPEALAAALAWQLQRLDAMRRMGHRLFARPQLGRDTFLRPAAKVPAAPSVPAVPAGACTLTQLLAAYAGHLKRQQTPRLVVTPSSLMSVDAALARLRAGLGAVPGWESFLRYLPEECLNDEADPLTTRAAVAATFVACLELAREGAVRMRQARPFGPIFIIAAEGGSTGGG